jgi:imidazolonepropionase
MTQRRALKIFTGISQLVSMGGAAKRQGRRIRESDLGLMSDAALVSLDGKIKWVGPKAELSPRLIQECGGSLPTEETDLGGLCVMPGLVECHTHLVFAGDRSQEFEWRIQGQTYQEIAAKGGGIRHTVDSTRKASEEELLSLAQIRADRFVRQGVTTLEIKSGYGLDLLTELRLLRVAKAVIGPHVVTTYLGPHSRAPETPDFDQYIEVICREMLPRLPGLADRVDIYIENGFFTPAQAERYLGASKDLGLQVTAHVEQLSDSGGAEACLQFQPQSLDHLVYASDDLIRKLGQSETTAVLLPVSDLYLRMQYPRARAMIDQGVRVALSTDFNPGTSPTQDLSLVGVLARLQMQMTLPEVISALTIGSAHALNLQNECGSLEPGKWSDFVVLDGSWRELFYSVGHHPVKQVYRGGTLLAEN